MKINWLFAAAIMTAATVCGASRVAAAESLYRISDDPAEAGPASPSDIDLEAEAPPAEPPPAEAPQAEAPQAEAPQAEAPQAEPPAPVIENARVNYEASQKDAWQKHGDCGCGVKACDGKGCGAKGHDGKGYGACELEPWELFPKTCGGLKIGGHVQTGYHTQGRNGNGTGLFNDYPNRVQAQQAWVYAEKETDTGGCGWDWGFRMDYVYGTDAQNTQAFGSRPGDWDTSWDNGVAYGHAIPQAYATLAYNNLTVKAGHFFTIHGYEVIPATGNFFYSHSFTFNNNEPFTHTGILGEYNYNDLITLWGGWTQGWDTGFSDDGGNMFLGGFSLALRDNVTLTYATSMGDFGTDTSGFGSDETGYNHSVVLDVQVTDRLNYVIHHDYFDNDIFMFGPGVIDKSWSIVQYTMYTINDCWAIGFRHEYYEDERNGAGLGFPPGGINSYTAGLNWTPHTNVRVRPEVRLDDFQTGAPGFQDSTTFGVDAILTF